MKNKYFLLFFSLLLSFTVSAQITITSVNLPKKGDVYQFGMDSVTTINIGTAGASAQTWDFTALQPMVVDTVSFIDPALTKHGSSFPTAQMASITTLSKSASLYLKETANGLFNVGLGARFGKLDIVAPANPEELYLPVPATFGSVFPGSGIFLAHLDVNKADGVDTIFTRRVSKILEADAWGSMKTVLGTNDVIRLKAYAVLIDSILIKTPVQNFGIQIARDTTKTYHFLTNTAGIRHPLATVVTNDKDSVLYAEFLMQAAPPIPKADFRTEDKVAYIGIPQHFVNLSSGGTSWFWDFGDGATSTQYEPSHTYTAKGFYTVKLKVTNAAGSDSMVKSGYVEVRIVGIDEKGKYNFNLDIYPNPAQQGITLQTKDLPVGDYLFTIFNLLGQPMIMEVLPVKNPMITIKKYYDLGNLPAGNYFYRLQEKTGSHLKSGKLIINP